MSGSLEFEVPVHLVAGCRGRKRIREGKAPKRPKVPKGRFPRVSRLMALVIHFDELIRRGDLEDYSEIARLGHVTPARVAQIMCLLLLAPDIQEGLLFLPRTVKGRDRFREREVLRIAAEADWQAQRAFWSELSKEARNA